MNEIGPVVRRFVAQLLLAVHNLRKHAQALLLPCYFLLLDALHPSNDLVLSVLCRYVRMVLAGNLSETHPSGVDTVDAVRVVDRNVVGSVHAVEGVGLGTLAVPAVRREHRRWVVIAFEVH